MTGPVPGQHDVVGPRPLHFKQAQFRFSPDNPVVAFGITGHLRVLVVLGFGHASIIHAQEVAILKHGEVG